MAGKRRLTDFRLVDQVPEMTWEEPQRKAPYREAIEALIAAPGKAAHFADRRAWKPLQQWARELDVELERMVDATGMHVRIRPADSVRDEPKIVTPKPKKPVPGTTLADRIDFVLRKYTKRTTAEIARELEEPFNDVSLAVHAMRKDNKVTGQTRGTEVFWSVPKAVKP